jgi:polysaccharide biosynthesis/export protein
MRYITCTILTTILTALLITATPFGQSRQMTSELPVGIGDLLEISVYNVPDFSRELRVTHAGTIRLPFLGDIRVVGQTASELETTLAALLDGTYVKDPQVSVFVKEPRSRMFSVLGAVHKPGRYQMLEPITLVTAISAAGGLDLAKAGNTVMIQGLAETPSHVTPAGAVAVDEGEEEAQGVGRSLEVDLKKLLEGGDLSLDVPIQPGDVVSVPERVELAFYVIGDVGRPGQFAFPEDRGINLRLAVAMAGGPTKTSKLKDTMLLRQLEDGSIQQIPMNLDNVLRGKSPDFEMKPNDLVFVPGSVTKNLAWGLLGIVPYALSRAIVGF